MRKALLSLDNGDHRVINHAQVFFPFQYDGLHDRQWDLVIIEGWFEMITSFIHEIRAVSYPGHVKVLFYCLDPQLPGLPYLAALDVDGFLTNSLSMRDSLMKNAPSMYVPLAVDVEAFPLYPSPQSPGQEGRQSRVVYVGAAGALQHKHMLTWMLREAVPFGLDIYGSGWDLIPEFSQFWRGVLPDGELAHVYGTALAVLGVTMDDQRESGMVNNRVFEALAVGAPLISDCFPELEHLFPDGSVLCAWAPGDVKAQVERLIRDNHDLPHSKSGDPAWVESVESRRQRRGVITRGHTWVHRVKEMLGFASQLPSTTGEDGRCWRKGCLSLAIVTDPGLKGRLDFETTFALAAASRLEATYQVDWLEADWCSPQGREGKGPGEASGKRQGEPRGTGPRGKALNSPHPPESPCTQGFLRGYDMVWAVGERGGSADWAVRADLGATGDRRVSTSRLMVQLRGLVLWGEGGSSLQQPRAGGDEWGSPEPEGWGDLSWYDVVYYQTEMDRAPLAHDLGSQNIHSLQHAWGIGSGPWPGLAQSDARVEPSTDVGAGTKKGLDVLVIGTDSQLEDMLQQLDGPGLHRLALGVLVAEGHPPLASRPGLSSLLAAAGISLEREHSIGFEGLPLSVNLTVVQAEEPPTIEPRPVEVIFVSGAEGVQALADATTKAARVIITAKGDQGLWATLLALASGFPPGDIRIPSNSSNRARGLVQFSPTGWDLRYYSRQLVTGFTRALCLGRGNSLIRVVRPQPLGTVVHTPGTTAFEVMIKDFHVGRDGEWCLLAEGRVLLCIWRHRPMLLLKFVSSVGENERMSATMAREKVTTVADNVTKGEGPGSLVRKESCTEALCLPITLRAELRSNIYKDVVHQSEDVIVHVCPSWLVESPRDDPYTGFGDLAAGRESGEEQKMTEPLETYSVTVDVRDYFRIDKIVCTKGLRENIRSR
ncbi:unnamed protein product [Discosporangium mesarthrocarpum]